MALWAAILIYVISALAIPGFMSLRNSLAILGVMLPLLVLASGQTIVVLTAGIDLSQLSVMALSGVCGAMFFGADGWLHGSPAAVPVGILVMLLVGVAAGFLNGTCVGVLGMPAFIVTLVTMMLGAGLAVWMARSETASGFPEGYVYLGELFPSVILMSAFLVYGAHLLLSRTAYGTWVYSVGQNPRTSFVSGIPVRRVIVGAYVFASLCAVIAAILLTARLESASPVLGKRMLLDVIGATVIGGTSLYGGRGRLSWTLFGVAFLAIVDNSLNLAGASFATTMMAKGGIILGAASLDAASRKERAV